MGVSACSGVYSSAISPNQSLILKYRDLSVLRTDRSLKTEAGKNSVLHPSPPLPPSLSSSLVHIRPTKVQSLAHVAGGIQHVAGKKIP